MHLWVLWSVCFIGLSTAKLDDDFDYGGKNPPYFTHLCLFYVVVYVHIKFMELSDFLAVISTDIS